MHVDDVGEFNSKSTMPYIYGKGRTSVSGNRCTRTRCRRNQDPTLITKINSPPPQRPPLLGQISKLMRRCVSASVVVAGSKACLAVRDENFAGGLLCPALAFRGDKVASTSKRGPFPPFLLLAFPSSPSISITFLLLPLCFSPRKQPPSLHNGILRSSSVSQGGTLIGFTQFLALSRSSHVCFARCWRSLSRRQILRSMISWYDTAIVRDCRPRVLIPPKASRDPASEGDHPSHRL